MKLADTISYSIHPHQFQMNSFWKLYLLERFKN